MFLLCILDLEKMTPACLDLRLEISVTIFKVLVLFADDRFIRKGRHLLHGTRFSRISTTWNRQRPLFISRFQSRHLEQRSYLVRFQTTLPTKSFKNTSSTDTISQPVHTLSKATTSTDCSKTSAKASSKYQKPSKTLWEVFSAECSEKTPTKGSPYNK